MSKFRNTAAGLGLLAAMILGAGAATAEPAVQGYTTAGVNLRAGPSTTYPVVATMRAGDEVTIYGCLSGWTWCDIDWRGYRGWAAGQYLDVPYQQHHQPILSYGEYVGVPFLSFSIGSYWNDHYRDRTFFGDMQRYQGPDVGQKPPAETNQPQAQQPPAQQPQAQPPKAQQPPVQQPKAQQPQAQPPKAQQPPVQQPKAQQPPVQQPKAQQPKIQQPKVQKPQGQQPQAQQPKGQKPKIPLPDAGQPQGQKCEPGQNLVNGACQ